MLLPKKWGQGQLFAFSALDGPSYAGDDFAGMLSGDRIGIRFFSKVRRELALVNGKGSNPEFDAVTGDYIQLHFDGQEPMGILYADQHLIIGKTAGEALPVVFTEGRYQARNEDGATLQDTLDGEITGLLCEENRFAFAFGHSGQEVSRLLRRGIRMDFREEAEKKLDFFRTLPMGDNHPYPRLYAKCASVMKTQLYSPEGEFSTIWSTPDRLPHAKCWLWDSVFHALGHRHIDPKLAEDLIRALWVHQDEDGFIPHMAFLGEKSNITQPPVMGWGSWKLYETSHDKAFLAEAYAHNRSFLNWCDQNRRLSDKALYTWETHGDANCRCDECGIDNSPRFDEKGPLYAIDFSCFMANDVRAMKRMADELHRPDEAAFYESWYTKIAEDVNRYLWSEEAQFYFDYSIPGKALHPVWSVASFLPLFAGICDDRQAACLVHHLRDPESFGTPFPIPSVSRKDPTFGTDMWRGPVWINYNYMICEGLSQYGYGDFGREIMEKTIGFVNSWYQDTGTIYEFYDSNNRRASHYLNRKGPAFAPYNIDVRLQAIRDYGWSCTLLFDWLNQTW